MSKKGFKPAWWLPGPHLQTLWPNIMRRKNNMPLRRERVELPDGDFVDLDWTLERAGPIVLLLHGLEGSAQSPYAMGMLQALSRQKWRSAVMHFRGCSGEVNRLARAYHSGDTTDTDYVVSILKTREPNTPLAIIGFSLGGNVLLKWLGETKTTNAIDAAVAVSVPFLLNEAVDHLHQGFSRIYERHLLKLLLNKIARKKRLHQSLFLRLSAETLKTIREFDDRITAPLHGFMDAADYYHQSSSRQFLKSIAIPTLILQAKDDPFMPHTVIPSAEELSANIQLEVSSSGGHVGFIGGNIPGQPRYWLEERIPLFLEPFLNSANIDYKFELVRSMD